MIGARGLLGSAREQLVRWTTGIPGAARLELTRGTAGLDGRLRALRQAAAQRLAREQERTEGRERRLRLADPRRVVERGYTILRLGDGRVLTSADAAPPGTAVRAELREGRLQLRSEGGDEIDGQQDPGA